MTNNASLKWTLITIEDPQFLPGKSICNIIQLISNIINFEFVVLDYIHGAASDGLILSLQNKQNNILKLNKILPDLFKVIQFDWGDFFLFKKYPVDWNSPIGEQYPYVISQTDTTIRAVDDQYIYIYTPYQEIVELIKKKYDIESIITDNLENLNYPE